MKNFIPFILGAGLCTSCGLLSSPIQQMNTGEQKHAEYSSKENNNNETALVERLQTMLRKLNTSYQFNKQDEESIRFFIALLPNSVPLPLLQKLRTSIFPSLERSLPTNDDDHLRDTLEAIKEYSREVENLIIQNVKMLCNIAEKDNLINADRIAAIRRQVEVRPMYAVAFFKDTLSTQLEYTHESINNKLEQLTQYYHRFCRGR